MIKLIRNSFWFNILLLWLIVVGYPAKAQSLVDDCSNLKDWRFESNVFRITYDSLQNYTSCNIRYLNRRTSWLWNKKGNPESFSLIAGTMLPKDSINICLSLKSRHLDSLLLKIFLYGTDETRIDSQVYKLDANATNRFDFVNTKAAYMQMQLYGESSQKNDTVSLQIQSLDVRARNHDLKQWMQTLDTASIDIRSIIPLRLVDRLDEFRNKKIIGLGESFHGGMQMQTAAFDVIRNLLYQDVRLVCFEMSVDMVMNWDLYVQGILPREYRYKILEELKMTLNDAFSFVEFLDEIRMLNTTRMDDEKIHVVGLDLRLEGYYLFEYFKAYQDLSKDKNFLVQFMLTDLYNISYHFHRQQFYNIGRYGKDWVDVSHSTLVDKLKSEEKLQKLMKDNDYRFMLETLAQNIPTNEDARNDVRILDIRDSIMWNVLQAAIDCYAPAKNDRVVVYAHSMHLSRTFNPYSFYHLLGRENLGCYIAKHYGDDFWTASIHAGGGSHKTGNLSKPVECLLQNAFSGSFESAANKTSLSNFYCRSSDLNDIFIFRMIANQPTGIQFYPLDKNRFDGYIFIDRTAPSHMDLFDSRTKNNREATMRLYRDSILISLADSSKIFNYLFDPPHGPSNYPGTPVEASVPRGFSWKEPPRMIDIPTGGTLMHGFFESDDKECVLFFDNVGLYNSEEHMSNARKTRAQLGFGLPYDGDIMMPAKENLLRWLDMKFTESRELRERLEIASRMKSDSIKILMEQNFDLVLEKENLVHVWSNDDAAKIYNADKVIEYIMDRNSDYFAKYRHVETINAEKNGRIIILRCMYSDEGYKNKAKYRKAIESIFKFK